MTERRNGISSPPVHTLWFVPGVCATDVCQLGRPTTRGLQQVEAAVDVCPDAPFWEVLVLRGHGGQI